MWIAMKQASQRKSRSRKISRRLRLQRGSQCGSAALSLAPATSERQPPRVAAQLSDSSGKSTAANRPWAANRPAVVARPALWRALSKRGTVAEQSKRLLIATTIIVRRAGRTRKTDLNAVR